MKEKTTRIGWIDARRGLAVYLVHQPVIFGVFFLFETLRKG